MTMLDRLLRAPARRSVAALAVVALSVPVSLAGPLPGATADAPADPCALTVILENPCRPLLGAESNGYTPSTAVFRERMDEHVERIGRPLDIVHIYVTDKLTMTAKEKSVASDADKIALVNWRLSLKWTSAADGSLDDQIDAMVTDLKTIPQKVMLTIGHEPEIHVSPGGDNPSCPSAASTDSRGTTQDYVNMWHHVRERFDAAGVDNVVWVMNYLGYSTYFGCAEALWPGNAYVDWVMWDPYPKNKTFTETVGGFYKYLTDHSDEEHAYLSKPWGLAEWGYTGTDQDQAYAMYASARNALHDNTFPKLKAYVIWDNIVKDKDSDDRVGFDRSGEPDAEEQAAYNAFANDPTFSPDSTPPTQVTGLAADSVTATSAQLSWQPATDAVRVAGYRVYRDDVLLATLGAGATGYDDTGLDDATTYGYTVRAVDPSGNESSPSAQLPVTTPDVTAPTVPGSLVVTPGKKQVSLSWSASSDNVAVSGYQVLRNGSPLPTTTGTSFTDTGLDELTTYSYSVVAFDSVGNASPAVSRSAKTLDSTAPKAPTSLKATVSGRSVKLTWTRPTDNVGVTSYAVYRGSTLLGNPAAAAFTDTTPPQATRLTYTVRAVDGAANISPTSTAAAAIVPDSIAPANPTRLTATPGSKRITLSWTRASDNVAVTGYWLYRGSTRIKTLPATTLSYANTGLRTGTNYGYRLLAVDAAGNRSTGLTATAKSK